MKPKWNRVFWLLPIGVSLFAFYQSSLPGVTSGGMSIPLARTLQQLLYRFLTIDISFQTAHFLVRKGAHLFIYFWLGFTFLFAYHRNFSKLSPWILVVFIVPVIDESIQYFIPGRVMAISDMLIDSVGIILGFIAFSICLFILRKLIGLFKRGSSNEQD